jgi:preprotein translocase subunit SecG
MSNNKRVNPTSENLNDEDRPLSAKNGSGGYSGSRGTSNSLRLLQLAVCILAVVLIIVIIVFAVLISRRPQHDDIEKIDYNRKMLEIQEGGKFGALYAKSGAIGVGIDNPSTEFDVLGDIHAYGTIHGQNVHSEGGLSAVGGILAGINKGFFVNREGKLALQHYNLSLPLADALSVNGTSQFLGEVTVGGADGVVLSKEALRNVGSVDLKAGAVNLAQGGNCVGRSFQVDKAGDVFFCKGGKLYRICCGSIPV